MEVFVSPLAETELSKIERSFKLISVVLSERGSKETLGDRFLAQIRRNVRGSF
jgi:hypothetical protein